ncbi:putative unusual protein kinase regulating ubiquinone biosynthesis (AarF/ABC1/UbiB family) [Gelidibacter sediminis]|uniref:Putative unusual protein kinase regulating ubiquinone biosynthesis (AarF/ABC1/UbiB family) n=1 Tax=Gelidibacter sediminis TaxID=1608710 RepID=A0A4R7PIR8_9FLAO|nr:AarF/UbiB family protein [Gelidibacter sediminis]TDU33719.1 putative unusual protein kinase regulating ubiquinone biosynthesis (AarF/ABC1/UbiB family) [Gelidibacter sediminis]
MTLLPENIDRYRKFFTLLIKYWNSDILDYSTKMAMGDADVDESGIFENSPEELTEDLKKMGPAYIKLGQLLSTRPDLLPEPHLKALQELQDDVDPIDFETVQGIFEKEVGTRISKAFKEFDPIPLASASIGQVHVGMLHSGQKVAIKIQRPQIREKFLSDLNTLSEMAEWAVKHSEDARKYNVSALVEELRFTLLKELDYQAEAQNLLLIKRNLKQYKNLFVPSPILDYSTSKVLTMEYVEGKKVTAINPLRRIEENLDPLVDDLVRGYLKQVIVDGTAHADPHPGNVHITPQNKLALMDLGMVAQFPEQMQERIMQLMLALSEYDSEQVISVLMAISTFDPEKADIEQFKKEISRMILENQNHSAGSMRTGRLIIQMNRTAAQNDITLPVTLNMLAKILLNLDQIVAVLSPNYKINDTIRDYMQEIMQAKMLDELKPASLLNLALETKKLAEKMPERLNTIMENLANNQMEFKVKTIDETRFTDAFQKVANRITLGIIIAAMIIGAAMLIRIKTSFTIAGYPALAIILFVIAAVIGFYVIYQIVIKDENFKN